MITKYSKAIAKKQGKGRKGRAATLNALAVISATEEAITKSFNYHTGEFENYEAHFGKGLKKFGKKLKKALKNVGKAIVKVAKNTIGNVALAPLLPFVPAMKKGLKKAGSDVPKNLPDLAAKFYQVVIQKKKSFEYDNSLEDKVKSVDPVVTPMIIGAIVSFIKSLLQKKAEGGALTPEEEEIAGGAEEAADSLTAEASEQVTQQEQRSGAGDSSGDSGAGGGGMGDLMKYLPIALIAVVALYFIAKK